MIGKVPPEALRDVVFAHTGDLKGVYAGPAYGEDAAAVLVGDQLVVVSSDPISLAAERVGTLGVHVACNDVAASGADPGWLLNVVFLPSDDRALLETVMGQLDAAARRVGVGIIGGHSEYLPALSRPLLSLTCFGVADRFVLTGGARPGDRVVLTKGAGIEGTAIIATDFRDDIRDAVPGDVLERAAGFFEDISVIPDARIVRGVATGMHDPTEGGVVDGLVEVAVAAGVEVVVERAAVPVREETRVVCEALGVDPLRVFGSGGLVATVPADAVGRVVEELARAGVDAAAVGRVRTADEPGLVLDGEVIREPGRDELYAFWE